MKELTYSQWLLPAVTANADRVGFHDNDYTGTWAQHLDRTTRLNRVLVDELKMFRGEVFAVLCGNSHHYIEAYHAAALGGPVINPLNPRLTATDIAYILDDADVRVAMVDNTNAKLLADVVARRSTQTIVITTCDPAEVEPLFERTPGVTFIDYELAIANTSPVLPAEPEETDPVVLMYTGGTTGSPKGALLSHRAEMLNLMRATPFYQLDTVSTFLHLAPMFHASAVTAVFAVPAAGSNSVILPGFDARALIEVSRQHQVTHAALIPTMIAMMFAHPDYDPAHLASWRWLLYGAQAIQEPVLKQILTELPQVDLLRGYGMTEAAQWVSSLGPEAHRRGGEPMASVGKPMPGLRVEVHDLATDTALPVREVGEICVRGGNFMDCYWNQPQATAAAFRGGWYHTGDAGYLDEEGNIYLVDRVNDVINTGGEKVFSLEVETVLATHPAVAQVAVIGVPHEVWGEEVYAIVAHRPEMSVTEEELRTLVRSQLAGYKVPKAITVQSTPLPTSASMKVLKCDLRAQAAAARTDATDTGADAGSDNPAAPAAEVR